MPFSIGIKKDSFGQKPNIFGSEQIRWCSFGVTIDPAVVVADGAGRKILYAGTPLGKIAATGKHGPYDAGAADGRQTCLDYVLGETVDVTDGEAVARVFDHAVLLEARLPVAPDAAVKTAWKNITLR